MIDKEKLWKYLNISDSIYAFCIVIGIFFFFESVKGLLGLWFVTFLCSGLALRRYCKGKPIMRYGSIVDENDEEGAKNSYLLHCWTIIPTTIVAILFTIYHIYV
ncbi:TPA: hypothetical protein ACN35K_004578 [Vibrio parahaemolyticus]